MDNYAFSNQILSEEQIQLYICQHIPGITYPEMFEVRNMFIYDNVPLEKAVSDKFGEYMRRKWNKSKDKKYYRVNMKNGGTKIMYAPEEQMKATYSEQGYTEIE